MNIPDKFTSESVGEGHPDKVADFISDSILDACLEQDPDARVACETLVKDNHVVLAGEISTKARVDYESIVRDAIKTIGYCTPADDEVFYADGVEVLNFLSEQSPDIAQGVNAEAADGKEGCEQGAGDQGIMFGFATDETPEYMPAPIMYAHRLMRTLADARRKKKVPWLRPDSKCQVTVVYGADGHPEYISDVVLSTQHTEDVTHDAICAFCIDHIEGKLPEKLLRHQPRYHINPTGRFVIGGPHGDSGLTGRKIIVDTYGGMGHHGGGAFSGKDCSKVDRSGAYMCRWVAKHLIAAGLARRCELQVAYAIGMADPVSIMVDTFGTSQLSSTEITRRIRNIFSFKPADMEKALDLRRPMFTKSTNYGHFTDQTLPWEIVDPEKVSLLREK